MNYKLFVIPRLMRDSLFNSRGLRVKPAMTLTSLFIMQRFRRLYFRRLASRIPGS